MTFSVTVLGSSSAIPTLTRNPSAHLLNAGERLFLLDCGEGTQLRLRQQRIHFQRIRHIFITHLHGDHYYGLIGLITTFHLLGRKEELHLHAHPALKEIIDIQLQVSQTVLQYDLVFHPLDLETYSVVYEDDRIIGHSFPLRHSIPTCGFIFREKILLRKLPEKRSYAYCTDTVYDETMIPYISGAGLLYHEATFMQDKARDAAGKMHATAMEAAAIAKKANVKKLLIGHYSARYEDLQPLLDEAKSVFPETYLAEDGLSFDV